MTSIIGALKDAEAVPTVSVGIPVYNGAATLAAVLDNLGAQRFQDFEIVISDNGSTDKTPEICETFATRDRRVRYYRRNDTQSATANFNYVLKQARAPFFMWCAHDDTRNEEFVGVLLQALGRDPGAILAFGKVVEYRDGGCQELPLDFSQKEKQLSSRLRWAALSPLHHLYGMWRTEQLRKIQWDHADWWHDTPLMMAATVLGDFAYEPKAELHYRHNSHPFFVPSKHIGHADFVARLRLLFKRTGDVLLFIWLCGRSVYRVAGFKYGLLAAFLGAEKIALQVIVFIRCRLKSPSKVWSRKSRDSSSMASDQVNDVTGRKKV